MKKKILITFAASLAAASMITGCGSGYSAESVNGNSFVTSASKNDSYSSYDDVYYDDYYDECYDDYSVAEAEYDDGSFGTSSVDVDASASQSNKTDTSRKLIKTVRMDVETLQYDDLLFAITTQVNACGGYIEESYTYNGSIYDYSYSYYKSKNGTMTIRIPANKLDEFLESFSPLCNVLNKTEGVEDVTLTYVDIESRKNALLVEEARLLELLECAENLEDMLTIESRLTEVRYQLESIESQLRTYDNKVNYSTVYLSITEVKEITPEPEPEPETAWERIAKGFKDSMHSVGHGLSEFGIWFVINLPYIVLWVAIILAHVFIIRGIVRFNIKKNKKRREMAENPYKIIVGSENMQTGEKMADNTSKTEEQAAKANEAADDSKTSEQQ